MMKFNTLALSLLLFGFAFPASAATLDDRVRGRILLQVESRGEAWYVNPNDGKRSYLSDGVAAYNLMRANGLGVSNSDLIKIPVGIEGRFQDTDTDSDGLPDKLEEGLKTDPTKIDTDGDGFSDGTEVRAGHNPLGSGNLSTDQLLVARLRGKILLQVQSRGEAWYLNPADGKRYYLKNGEAAYQIMRFLSLGITNSDLIRIRVGSDVSSSPATAPPVLTSNANPETPLTPNKTRNTGSISWGIIFTHAGERLPDAIKNDLCTGNSTSKLSYLPIWFQREANKYEVSLSISLNCYSQQIELPSSVFVDPDHYTAFGQSIPLPLNTVKTKDYILQTIPSLQNSDLITVVNYVTSGSKTADVSSIGGNVSFVFIVKSNFIDGIQYYAPNVTEPNIDADPAFVKSVAHEALHNFGAYDHYDYSNPGNCQTETDQSLRYMSPRIMCAANLNNFADYIIPPETAKEIGWVK